MVNDNINRSKRIRSMRVVTLLLVLEICMPAFYDVFRTDYIKCKQI